MKKFNFLFLCTLLFLTSMSFAQGVTTGSINGRVLDNNDSPLSGANIVATHIPTGSVYGAVTDFDGFYRITNMKSGGPYTLMISYVGFEDYKQEGILISLGESKRISTKMAESASALDEIVISATNNGIFNSNKTGTETSISERDINTLPTVSRSVADFARVTPSAQITEGNDGFSISLGGQNNRYNSIYIDGAVNNDVFGLAGSGTNGGQTGVNPFSVDAIESFQINLAPFDVRQSGFTGGSINAVTRSGSNIWEGSAYGFYRNESLAGKTPVDLVNEGDSREKLDEFTALTYGVRIGGPIIKDKLFFFANYERQEDETPQPFNFSNYTGDSSIQDINNLSSFLQSNYGYNPGIFDNNTRTLDSDKLNLRFDLNAGQNHKLYLRLGVVQAENLEARNSGNRNIGFINGSEYFETSTYSGAFEWSANLGPKYANNLKLGYTAVRDDRDPYGSPFPTVDIQDGAGTISFGAEPFSTANLLNQDVFTINNNFEIFSGRHAVTLGTNLEWASAKNLFFAFNFGDYTFEDQFDNNGNLTSSGLNQFLTGQNADVYQHGYSLVGNGIVGDDSAGSADFKTFQAGFYVQDEVQVTDNFKVTGGIRVDLPYFEDGPSNQDFNTRTVPLLEAAGKDLQGARVGQGLSGTAMLAPRLGFNLDVFNNNTTQVRGGLGVFTSRLPLVWPGGTYNNNGVTGGYSNIFNISGGVNFNPDINNQPVHVAPGSGGTGGNIDLSVGEGNTGVGGDVTVNAGITSASDNTGGAVTIASGKGTATSSGAVSISTSDGGTAGVSGRTATILITSKYLCSSALAGKYNVTGTYTAYDGSVSQQSWTDVITMTGDGEYRTGRVGHWSAGALGGTPGMTFTDLCGELTIPYQNLVDLYANIVEGGPVTAEGNTLEMSSVQPDGSIKFIYTISYGGNSRYYTLIYTP